MRDESQFITPGLHDVKHARIFQNGVETVKISLMTGNLQIFPGIAERISMTTRWKKEEKDTEEMISIMEGRAKVVDMQKKSCICGLGKIQGYR